MSLSIFNGFNFGKVQTQNVVAGGGVVGGWKELGRTTLGSNTKPITVSSLTNKRYYMALVHKIPSGGADADFRFGSGSVDSGNNYAFRKSEDGSADTTGTSQNYITNSTASNDADDLFSVGYVSNYSTKEKLFMGWSVGGQTVGAGNAPERSENVGKWTNTTNALDIIQIFENGAGGNFATGSELVVLGYDPSDTHTTNFWEEIGTDTGDGVNTDLTATFTSKKYIWIQAFLQTSATATLRIRTGNGSIDTGANYSNRYSTNGAGETTSVSDTTFIDDPWIDGATNTFYNIFMINNSSNEKLIIGHRIDNPTVGAGSIGNRLEFVGKWANTSVQADRFQFNLSTGNMGTSSIMKVWGSN